MRDLLDRREMLMGALSLGAASMFGGKNALLAQMRRNGRPTGQEMGEINRIDQAFRRKFQVPASSIAISRNGQFVYDRASGTADKQHALQVDESSLFRIASVTKPITSVAIFMLMEQGKLNLTDKVFGPSSLLGTRYGKGPYKAYVTDVTVDHLLTHTSGGWPNDNPDPMFQHDGWDHEKLITWTIDNLPLTYPPGQHWAYSNFGYCVLGRVIEAVTGQSYADWVKANVLAPCGITDMQIAQNKESQKASNEVVYYGQFGENPYGINVTRMDSHGGWIATPSDLVKFLNHVAGAPGIPALLKPATIKTMTTPAAAYDPNAQARYARGWMVRNNGAGNWWHNGSLPGSTTIMVRTSTGMCWAALTNTRSQPSNEIDAALDQMIWDIARCVPEWGA
jgi:CubicO group peptidase (beta-lactamase class C family)